MHGSSGLKVSSTNSTNDSYGQLMVGAVAVADEVATVCGTCQVARARPDLRSLAPSLQVPEPVADTGRGRSHAGSAGRAERRRLARDLHDGVQGELVSLLIRLKQAEEDPVTPPALARTFAALGDHATAALDSVRRIALGIDPPALARLGVVEALRIHAARASTTAIISGAVPRSSDEAEAAVYFSCLEAIQNVVKHAGRGACVTVSVREDYGTLAVRVKDDGRGFDPARVEEGAGVRNIRDRINALGGDVELASELGRGTVVTLWLPWLARQPGTRA